MGTVVSIQLASTRPMLGTQVGIKVITAFFTHQQYYHNLYKQLTSESRRYTGIIITVTVQQHKQRKK